MIKQNNQKEITTTVGATISRPIPQRDDPNCNQKGITLVALVITIIILLILSAITIGAITGGDGILISAEEGAYKHGEAKGLEQINLTLGEDTIIRSIDKTNPVLDEDRLYEVVFDLEENEYNKKWIESVERIEEKDENGNDIEGVTIINNEGYIYDVIVDENGKVEIIPLGKNEGPLIREIRVINKNTNTIEIEVKTMNAEGVEYTYLYKKDGEEKYKEAEKSKSNTYTYKNLEANVLYNIKVEVKNNKGEDDKTINVLTGELTHATVQFTDAEWENGKASVQIKATEEVEGYEIQYQVGGIEGNWTEIENEGRIGDLNHGEEVYGRLWDGTNGTSPFSTKIEDGEAPIVTVTKGAITSNSITVNVVAIDNEWGMGTAPTYRYYIKPTSQTNWPTTATASSTSTSNTFTGLNNTQTYDIKVEVEDKAGNTGTGKLEKVGIDQVTSGETEGAIKFGNTTWNEGKASITISTNTSYKITYQKNGTEGNWTEIANNETISGLDHGNTIYARLYDGTNAGNYASTTIKDGTAPTVTVTKGVVTTNSITVTVGATDDEWGMGTSPTYRYYIKPTSQTNWTTTATASSTSTSNIFTGLNNTQTYDIKVEVEDKAGNTGTGKLEKVGINEVPSGTTTGVITFGSPSWSNRTASVTISTNQTGYTLQYQIGGTSDTWTTIESGGTVSSLAHNTTVYARLWDGTNAGNHASTTIQDRTVPTINTALASSGVTTKGFTISTKATDSQTGTTKIIWYYKLSTASTFTSATETWTATTSAVTKTKTYTGLTTGTYNAYAEVYDEVGNKTRTPSSGTVDITLGTVPAGTGAITFGNATWASGTASVTVSTNQTGYTLQYQKNSTSGTWTTITSGEKVTGLTHNDTVYARLWDGTNAGDYASTTIQDKTVPTINTALASSGVTTKGFTISTKATDSQTGTTKIIWYYKLSTASTYTSATETWTATTSAVTKTKTYTGLTTGTYNAYAEVYDEVGNKTRTPSSGTVNITLGTVPSGTTTGVITFGNATWASGTASVTVSTNQTGYTLQYQKNSTSGTWTTITSGEKVTGLTHNDTVYARLWDGTNGGNHASTTITDTTTPTVKVEISGTPTAGTNGWYKSDVVVKITGATTGSALTKVTYKLSGATTKTETTITNGGTITISAEGSTTVTAYAYTAAATSEAKTLTIKKDKTAPTINTALASSGVTTKGFTISTKATDTVSGTNKIIWYYKKSTADTYTSAEETWTATTTAQTKTKTYTGLTSGTYNAYAVIYDAAGNTTRTPTGTGTVNITLGTVPSGTTTGVITFGTPSWATDGTASVTVSTNQTGYTLQYQKNSTSGSWTTITSGEKVTGLTHDDTVYARLWDGTNGGNYASTTIKDGVKPTIGAFTGGNITTGTTMTIKATTVADKGGSGLKGYYVVKSSTTPTTPTATSVTWTANTSGTISITNKDKGTYYIWVIDNAGNVSDAKSCTVIQKVTSVSISATSKSIAIEKTFTINATANPDTANNRNITWSTSDSSVASISTTSTGSGTNITVTANKLGTATITATAADGSGKKATCAVTVTNPTIASKLKEGDYVNYVDKNGTTRQCVVLYGPENANYSSYGIQIITSGTLGTAGVTATNFDLLLEFFNDAISILNAKATEYLNTTYASSARSVGSVPDAPQTESSDTVTYHGYSFKRPDSNLASDWNQLKTLNIHYPTGYWLASRRHVWNDSDCYFTVMNPSTLETGSYAYYVCGLNNKTGTLKVPAGGVSRGVRPVFTLKPEVTVTGGSGTSGDPWILGTQ